jgi:benzoyl-CoA reductase subunit C
MTTMATTPAPTETQAALATLVERAEGLYHDVRFQATRAWKEAHPTRKAVGCMPVYFPRELIHSTGALAVGVMGGGDDVEIIRGDAYYQSYICHIPRSTIEMSLNGSLDCVDGMVFPSICDVIRNLSGMWKLLFEARPAWYFDMPQSFDQIGRDFYAHELELLWNEIAAISGVPADDGALRHSIELYNENRRLIEALYEQRRIHPWLYPTSEVYLIQRAGDQVPVEAHNEMLRAYMELAGASGRHPIDNARVVIVGSFCEQPPLNLLRTIERAGCYIVDDDLILGNRMIRGDVTGLDEKTPIRALVDAFIDQARAAAFLLTEDEKGAQLLARLRHANAEGVLFCAPSFCDPALLDQPMLVAAVEKAGLPYTSFKYAENTGQFQVIREQAGTFADSIKLWGTA